MPGRFQFQNIGSAMTDELSRVLAEREQKRRQDFLDSITLKRENRNDEIQRAQLDEVKQRNELLNDQRKQTMATGVAGLLRPGQKIDDATDKTLTEGNLGVLVNRKQDALHEALGPGIVDTRGVDGQLGQQQAAPVVTDKSFAGTPAQNLQIEVQQKQQQLAEALKGAKTRQEAVEMAAKFGVPYAQIDDVVNGFMGKEPPHSAIYNEWQDAKANGYKGDFTAYQNEDANRHKSTMPTFNINANDPAQSQALDMVAKNYAITGQVSGLGRGGLQSPFGQAVATRAAQYDKSTDSFVTGINPNAPNLAGNRADFTADSDSLKTVQKSVDSVSAYLRTADENAKILRGVIGKVPDTGIPYLNRPVRAIDEKLFGSENMAALRTIRQSVSNEYARIISSGQNIASVLSDSARKEMDTILDEDSTPNQIFSALNILHQEGTNRLKEYGAQADTIRGRIKGGQNKPQPEGPQPVENKETAAERSARLRKAAGLH